MNATTHTEPSRKQWQKDWAYDPPELAEGGTIRLLRSTIPAYAGETYVNNGVRSEAVFGPNGPVAPVERVILGGMGFSVPADDVRPLGEKHPFVGLYINDRVVVARSFIDDHNSPVGSVGTVIGFISQHGAPLCPVLGTAAAASMEWAHPALPSDSTPLPHAYPNYVLVHFDDPPSTHHPHPGGDATHWWSRGWLVPVTCLDFLVYPDANGTVPSRPVATPAQLATGFNDYYQLSPPDEDDEDDEEDEEDEDVERCGECEFPVDNCQCCPECEQYPCQCCADCGRQHCICDDDEDDDGGGLLGSYHDCDRTSSRASRWVPEGPGTPVFGIEMEYEADGYNARQDLLGCLDAKDLIGYNAFHCERDGSLSDSRGFELIAPPSTLAELTDTTHPWYSIMDCADGEVIADNYDAGMHVNMDRLRSFGNDDQRVARFVCFFNCFPFSVWLARRNNGEYAQIDPSMTFDTAWEHATGSSPKYRAVHVTGARVEVRSFACTTDPDLFLSRVQYVDALARWCVDNHVPSRDDSSYGRNGTLKRMGEFFNWVHEDASLSALHEQMRSYAHTVASNSNMSAFNEVFWLIPPTPSPVPATDVNPYQREEVVL